MANQASADYTALSAGVKDGSVVHITTKTTIDSAVIGTAEIADAAITDAKIGNISANHIITGSIDASKVTVAKLDAGNITTGTLSTDRLNVGKLSALSANLGDVTTGSLKGVDIVANSFSTPNGSFTTDANGNVVASNLTIRGVTNLVYNAALLGNSGTYPNTKVPGWNLFTKGYYSNATLHDGVPSIGFNSSTGSGTWVTFAQSKLYPLNGLHGQPYSASVWFVDDGSEAAMKYQFTLAFFDANGNRLASGYAGNTWNGNPTSQGWAYKTINNIISPSTAVYVAIQYWAYNGTGHALFSSPMLTQTAQSTGYQPDTGNVVSAGEIDGSVINGSTINGTTFNAGDIISSTYNTSRFYPTTITPAGLVATTGFNSMDGLRTEMSAGSFVTKYRAVHSSSNQYEAYDGVFSGDELALNSGFTNGIDMGFQQSVSGNQLTGQVVLSPLNGIHLWGSTQSIHFSGLQMNGTGITMNSYGNILADQGSTWWRVVDFSGKEIANFGTDVAGSNAIEFNRELDIGNFHINTGHTFTSWDKGAIHFAKGGGGAADIYAGAVNYTSLVKSSLLSVKRDVQKADTAYWAQLVNSIDLATYQYKTDDNTSHLRLSSIVDDVNVTKQWQLPDVFISRDENGRLNGVDDSVLLNATLATVQEQQKQIDQLNGHNMELEARLNKLEAKLNG
ncbi:tail fiber [Lactiplantibacillus plantarum]|uniref:phage tail protein n=1 Tax=Lactiplantibacillus plantarum TaxID=1590 RepID=UPI00244DD22F|nr:phage tail protein [Lactiplantibacillus plantarum]MCG0739784.1 tail fiber [Lactiplantibacillus plantarum]WGI44498.1 phage tail protein [Lactiplantibacillus plantarum]